MRIALLPILVLLPALAQAADVRGGEDELRVNTPVENDDLYVAGGTVVVEAPVRGDLVVAGGTITVTAPVIGDVMAAGGTVEILSEVQGSVRVAGGTVVQRGAVRQDLVAAGGTVSLGADATVNRDVILGGGEMRLEGGVGGDVRAVGGTLHVGGPVGGDVHARVAELVLAPGARISGSLSYPGDVEVQRSPDAQVLGPVTQLEPLEREGPALGWLAWYVRRVIAFFALGALLLLILPGVAGAARDRLRRQPGLSAGVGALALLVFPMAAGLVVMLGALVGGWWIGLFALALWALVLALGIPVAAYLVGELLLARAGRPSSRFLSLLLGMLLVALLPLIPLVGYPLLLAAAVVGAGALVLAVVGPRLQRREPVAVERQPLGAAPART